MALVDLLLLGVPFQMEAEILDKYKEFAIHRCSTKLQLQSILGTKPAPLFQMIVCGGSVDGVSSTELAQTVRMAFPQSVFLYISTALSETEAKLLKKNGYKEVYSLPEDHEHFHNQLPNHIAAAEALAHTAVPLVALETGMRLKFEFRIYLANKQKFVTYLAMGEPITKEVLERLQSFAEGALFISRAQLEEYADFSTQRLIELSGGPQGLVNPAQTKKLEQTVAQLLKGVIESAYEKEKSKADRKDHALLVIERFLTQRYPGDWLQKLRNENTAKGELYKRGQRISSYAALFGLCLRCPEIQDLVTAGMLGDIGLSELPSVLRAKSVDQMSPDEFNAYKTHPKLSVRLLKAKELAYSQTVYECIEFHHERWSGSGFPNRFRGARLSLPVQVIILANRIDELTRLESNAVPMTIDQALRQIDHEGCIGPEHLSTIKRMFSKIAAID